MKHFKNTSNLNFHKVNGGHSTHRLVVPRTEQKDIFFHPEITPPDPELPVARQGRVAEIQR